MLTITCANIIMYLILKIIMILPPSKLVAQLKTKPKKQQLLSDFHPPLPPHILVR